MTTAADWRDLPPGHYARPVETAAGELLGYMLYERKVRKRRGPRRAGEDQGGTFAVGTGHPLVTPSRFYESPAWTERGGTGWDSAVEQLLQDPDRYRAEYGKLTGWCGCCGRQLTDPDSKLIGIGPECIKHIRGGRERFARSVPSTTPVVPPRDAEPVPTGTQVGLW